jgi:hypothetical protein
VECNIEDTPPYLEYLIGMNSSFSQVVTKIPYNHHKHPRPNSSHGCVIQIGSSEEEHEYFFIKQLKNEICKNGCLFITPNGSLSDCGT